MKHIKHAKNKEVFKFGDIGYYFYVILRGTVGIKIPLNVETRSTRAEHMKFLMQNFYKICWENTPDGEKLKERVFDVMMTNNRKRETAHKSNENEIKDYSTSMFREVNVIGPGK